MYAVMYAQVVFLYKEQCIHTANLTGEIAVKTTIRNPFKYSENCFHRKRYQRL